MIGKYNTATGQFRDEKIAPHEDRGKLVPQKACIDCGKEWSMYESEIKFYQHLVETQDFNMPKRCPECRDKKRQSKPRVKIPDVIRKIRAMADTAINDDEGYTFNEDELAQELTDIATTLELFLDQNPGLSHRREERKYEKRQTVEQAPQSGSDQKAPR